MRRTFSAVLALGIIQASSVALFAQSQTPKRNISEFLIRSEASDRVEGPVQVVRAGSGGVATSSAARALIYSNPNDSGFFIRIDPAEGGFLADDLNFGNGFVASGTVSGYRVRVFNNGDYGPASVHVGLWDGDPLGIIDTGSFTNAPIPGTEVDFLAIGTSEQNSVHDLIVELKSNVLVPHGKVWMVISTDGCRFGWRASDSESRPLVGYSNYIQDLTNFESAGHCCQNPSQTCSSHSECGPAGRDLCTDGFADFSEYGCFDYCGNFVADVFAPAKTTFHLIPIEANGPASFVGQEVVIADPRVTNRLYLELGISGWSTTPNVGPERLRIFEGAIDADGYASGDGDPLRPSDTDPCTTDQQCGLPRFDGFGPVSWCTPQNYCAAGWIDFTDPDWVYSCCSGGAIVDLSGSTVPGYRYSGNVTANAPPFSDGTIDYIGSLMLDIPPNARGKYSVGFDYAFALDQYLQSLPLIGSLPARITIPTGRCCFGLGTGNPACVDDVTEGECNDFAPGRQFVRDATCSGDVQVDCAFTGPLQPCCTPQGTCIEVPTDVCADLGGSQAQLCLGDSDGSGADDVCETIPTLSAWGLAILALSLFFVARYRFGNATL